MGGISEEQLLFHSNEGVPEESADAAYLSGIRLYDNVPDRLIIGLSLAPCFDPIDHKRGNVI